MLEKRYIQRLDSFSRAFARLKELVDMIAGRETYSLFSKEKISMEEEIVREALKLGLISDANWMNMILDRNLSAHDYNDAKSKELAKRIVETHFPLLEKLYADMKKINSNEKMGEND